MTRQEEVASAGEAQSGDGDRERGPAQAATPAWAAPEWTQAGGAWGGSQAWVCAAHGTSQA